jgi:citronellyl-CoA dehydrogenase
MKGFFLVAGVKVSRLNKIGMHCSDTTQIHFDDVRVPADHIIGEEGMGFVYQMLQV